MANLKDRRCLDNSIEVKLRSERESAGPSGRKANGWTWSFGTHRKWYRKENDYHRGVCSMERVCKSVTDGRSVWSIIIKNGKYHFRGNLSRCDCFYSGCKKIRFPFKALAELYSRYQFMKYGRQNTVYWSDDCGCCHLRTSRPDDGIWVRRR